MLLGVLVLVALPTLVALRPVGHNAMSAATLLGRIRSSTAQPYSGYAESVGGLGLPVTDQFNSVADLLGGHTQMRTWWRGERDWRVDTVSAFGESDVHRDRFGTWNWSYEGLHATRVAILSEPAVRLPRAGDLLPPELARRLLSEATADEVTRLPVRRIAGVDAVGLRLRPGEAGSSIRRVDVWADPSTGLALRVEVYGPAARAAASTSFLDFRAGRPDAASTAFTPPAAADLGTSDGHDLASDINTFARVDPPTELAGLPRSERTPHLGSVGVYGRGVTELFAVPLWDRLDGSLRKQLTAAGAVATGNRQELEVGPISMLLQSNVSEGTAWLLTGTVTPQTLRDAADQILSDPPRRS